MATSNGTRRKWTPGSTCASARDRSRRGRPCAVLGLGDVAAHRQHRVGVHRDRVDAALDEKARELGVVARGLAAETDGTLVTVRAFDELTDHRADGGMALVEERGE